MLYWLFIGVLCLSASTSGTPLDDGDVDMPKDHKVDPDPAEQGPNDGGDLKLTEAQREVLYGDRAPFAAYSYAWLWTDGVVPYTIRENDFESEHLKEIKEAMRAWERDTCIRFVPRSNEENYIRVQDGKEGCNSYLGNIRQGEQPLNLAVGGCMVMGTYLHEIGHALGLIHEHQRPDRENYIHYYEKNINPGKTKNMKAYKSYYVDYYGVEFDLSSIMLYSLTAFSIDGVHPTLGVDNPFYEEHINGRRYRHLVSFGDLKVINKMYKCASRCEKEVDCPEPGFVNERCECVTKESYLVQRCKNNPDYEDWCDNRAIYGYCDRKDKYLQRHCMKSCDFCPIFSPGTSGLVKPVGCVNHYSDSKKCDEWAKKGYCDSYPSMLQRRCRKSCDKYEKTCSKEVGICANKLKDSDCYGYANHLLWDYCGSKKHWGDKAREQCPDSCKVCPK